MVEEHYSTEKLLALRRLTRATTDLLRGQIKEYLGTLAPLLRPQTVLGGYIQGTTKDIIKGADQAFKDLQALYESVADSKPYNLPKELKPPLDIISSSLDMTVMEYEYVAKQDKEGKSVLITSPLKWVLSYTGFSPGRLREILAVRRRDVNELRSFVLHYLVMHVVVSKQGGVGKILDALHFPLSSGRSPEFGDLPITYISSSIETLRPPDDVIVESTEVSGMDAFEEVVNINDIAKMREPLKERLIDVVKNYDDSLLVE
ncbi:MAG TPA: hypothetical protein VNI02_15170 [Blastocatellia bacterium]|nr:hypothetical protein [Blastocatellia bacterium]